MNSVIKILLVLLCFSSVSASECIDEFDNFKVDQSTSFIEFHGKDIPLLDGHVVKIPTSTVIFSVSRSCRGILQSIAVTEIKDCLFCSGSGADLEEYGIEILNEGIKDDVQYKLLKIGDMPTLYIWSDEYAFSAEHLNLQYLRYIINLYF